MIRKSMVIGILILLIGVNIIPSSLSEKLTSPTVIIVDDEGDGDYTSIREAVNNSITGDTILVYSGNYSEHSIYFNTSGVTLEGMPYEYEDGNDEGKPLVYTDDKKDIIKIFASNIIIKGFMFKMINYHETAILILDANNISISDNDINGSFGIGIDTSGYFNVFNNNIISSCNEGMRLMSPNFNNINHNTFRDNRFGISIYGGYFSIIEKNNFINNSDFHALGHTLQWDLLEFTTRWRMNYWGRPKILPKLIMYSWDVPFMFYFHCDWNPAQEPYDIGV